MAKLLNTPRPSYAGANRAETFIDEELTVEEPEASARRSWIALLLAAATICLGLSILAAG